MSIYSYVYKITNRTNNKFYIGSRRSNNIEPGNDLGVIYFTSGHFKKDFKENTESYDKEILFSYSDYEIVYWYEQLLIRESIDNNFCVNGHFVDPDSGNSGFFNNTGRKHTEESKLKMRKPKPPRTIEHSKAISVAKKGKKFKGGAWSDASKKNKSESYRGVAKTDEFKDKLRLYMTSDRAKEQKEKIKNSLRKKAAIKYGFDSYKELEDYVINILKDSNISINSAHQLTGISKHIIGNIKKLMNNVKYTNRV